MLEQMQRQGGNHQTTIIHIDPIDLNVMGIFHRQPTTETTGFGSELEQMLGPLLGEQRAENGLNFDQLLQYIMEHDPKYE